MGMAEIELAAERLGEGGLVGFPTETVYGLGCDARNREAVARVYAIKGRPANNPLIVHVSDIEMARSCAGEWPASGDVLGGAFWPGPLTLVVARGSTIPAVVAGGGDTLAIRVPAHPVALALIERFGGPIVGPSANRSGMVSATTAEHVRAQWGDEVLVLDGGACQRGIESTVVDISGDRVAVLRRGVIGAEQIARVLGREVEDAGGDVSGVSTGALASPGLLERHYAPRTPARLVDDLGAGELCEGAVVLAISAMPAGVRGIAMPDDAGAYARRLYAALREADAMGADEILIERPAREGSTPEATAIWRAIHDRLARATG